MPWVVIWSRQQSLSCTCEQQKPIIVLCWLCVLAFNTSRGHLTIMRTLLQLGIPEAQPHILCLKLLDGVSQVAGSGLFGSIRYVSRLRIERGLDTHQQKSEGREQRERGAGAYTVAKALHRERAAVTVLARVGRAWKPCSARDTARVLHFSRI